MSQDYAEDIAAADDLAMQDLFGVRPAPDFNADCICSAKAAQLLAQTLLQRHVGIRNEYEFRLGWRYALLEPGDLVTLTEPGLGLANTPVRITAVEEDSEGGISVSAEDWPRGLATAVLYPRPDREGGGVDTGIPAGSCNMPVIFEPPADLTGGKLQIWIGTSGGANWGGCEIHASRDDATYSMIGRIDAPARHGRLNAAISASATSAVIDLSISRSFVKGASQADLAKLETLSYLGGELIAYRQATLNAGNRYTLSNLRRGLFSTQAKAHPIGAQFMRLDDAVAKIDLERWNIGETIYFKLPSFNSHGAMLQDISKLHAVQYVIQGTGLEQWAAPTACTIALTKLMPT
jgi:hypothetical protein